MVNGSDLIQILIYLIVVGVIFGLLWWLIGYVALPAPFDKVCRVILAIFAVLVVIGTLLSATGHPVVTWGHSHGVQVIGN
jgi:predicted tellurium resistance membrane protein TerC